MNEVSKISPLQSQKVQKRYIEDGKSYLLNVNIRYDDLCKNGHNTFSLTGELYHSLDNLKNFIISSGTIHEDIQKHMPEMADLIKYHLCTSQGPIYYIENTLYLAGNKDCWGLMQGEVRQHLSRGKFQNNGIEGVKNWELEQPPKRDVYSNECPPPVTLNWKPSGMIGNGKARELESARRAAIWEDATDDELCQEPAKLKEMLEARLPKLLAEFRKRMESLGFIY